MTPPPRVFTRSAIEVKSTNDLDRPFHYEAVLIINNKTEAMLTAEDCIELGEMLVAIGTSKEA